MRPLGWALIQYNWCPYINKKTFGRRQAPREDHAKTHREVICKKRIEASEESDPAEPLISDFWSPEL